jgi:hypothetical protein
MGERRVLMTERLHVSSIEVSRFGGLGARQILLPTEPLVVIAGRNETGKTTLAELLSWLIAGPAGTAADAQRFGSPEDRVGGVLRGWLESNELEITGEFRIPKSGPPNDRGVVVRCGEVLGAASWRARLGGVDPQVFAAIYRLSGEQLHTGLGAHEQLSKVALAALSGRVDPNQLADRLQTQARSMSTGKSAGAVSVATLQRALGDVDADVRSARGTAELHCELTEELGLHESEREQLHEAWSMLGEHRQRTHLAIELWQRRQSIDQLGRQLAEVEVVPLAWRELIADPVAVRQAHDEADQAGKDLAASTSALALGSAELGASPETIARVRVFDSDLSAIAREVAHLRSAEESLRQARRRREECETKLAACDAVTRQLSESADLTPAQLVDVRFGVSEQARLSAAVARWDDCLGRDGECRYRAVHSAEEHRRAGEELVQAEQGWNRWLTGGTAEQWLMGVGAATGEPVPSVPNGSGGMWARTLPWLLAGLILAVSGAAAVGSQWVIAAVALVVALLAAAMASGRVHSTSRDGLSRDASGSLSGTVSQHSDLHARMHQDAIRVVEARRTLDVAELDRSSAEASVEHSSAAVVAARHAVESLAIALGVRLDAPDPSLAQSRITACAAAVDAFVGSTAAAGELALATSAVRARESDHAAVANRVRGLLEEAGITEVSALETADELASRYRMLHGLWMTNEQMRTRAEAAARHLEVITGAVRDQISGWRPERVVEETDRLRALQDLRLELEAQIGTARSDLDSRLGSDSVLRATVESGVGIAELHENLETAESQRAAAAETLRHISERIGEVKARLEELAGVERLAELMLRRGTLRQQQEEVAVDAITAAFAERMLRSVAQRFEREHQPALIEQAFGLAKPVAPEWAGLVARPGAPDRTQLLLGFPGGGEVPIERLSTGARALLYLALRVAMADHDAQLRRVALPLICDDPLVHLDDDRARDALSLLRSAAEAGRQVIVFTCHERTLEAAVDQGAGVVRL